MYLCGCVVRYARHSVIATSKLKEHDQELYIKILQLAKNFTLYIIHKAFACGFTEIINN